MVPRERHIERGRDEDAQARVGGELGGAGRESLRDHAVGVEWHVRAVLLGRADREQHGVDAGLDLSPDLLPGHPLDQVPRHGRLV